MEHSTNPMNTVATSTTEFSGIVIPERKKEAWEQLRPCGTMILIRIRKQQEKIGSIHLAAESRDLLHTAQPVAQVIALGPDCYTDTARFPSGPWVKPGDWIVIKPYQGQGNGYKLAGDEHEYRHIYCDSVLSVITGGDPYVVERFI